jgi:hypothetical protein
MKSKFLTFLIIVTLFLLSSGLMLALIVEKGGIK